MTPSTRTKSVRLPFVTLARDRDANIGERQDKVDDVTAKVKSTALLFASQSKPILSGFSATFVSLLALAGYLNSQGLPFYCVGVLGSAVHLFWQIKTVDLDSREDCWAKFKSNRDLGAIVWSGIAADYASKTLLGV
jgi:4-hydroxybenzoate polyprenyltransferase